MAAFRWALSFEFRYEAADYRLNTGMMHDGNLSMMPKGEKFSLGFTQ